MSTLHGASQGTGTRPLLLIVALLLLVGITAISVVAFDSGGSTPLQSVTDDAGALSGASGGGSAAAADGETVGASVGEGAGCNGPYEPTSEACELEGTVWDGGTIWP